MTWADALRGMSESMSYEPLPLGYHRVLVVGADILVTGRAMVPSLIVDMRIILDSDALVVAHDMRLSDDVENFIKVARGEPAMLSGIRRWRVRLDEDGESFDFDRRLGRATEVTHACYVAVHGAKPVTSDDLAKLMQNHDGQPTSAVSG